MRNTLCGLGLALALGLSGCSGGAGPAAGSSTASNTAGSPTSQLERSGEDVASVDLAAVDENGNIANRPLEDADEDGVVEGRTGDALVDSKVGLGSNDARSSGSSTSVEQLAIKALQGHEAEQEMAEIALEQSQNAAVKQAAQMISDDHRAAEAQLRQAASLSAAVDPDLSKEQEKVKDGLEDLSGADFDRAYVRAMVDDHEKDLKFYRQQAETAPTDALRRYFAQTVPVLEKHLEHCKKLRSEVG